MQERCALSHCDKQSLYIFLKRNQKGPKNATFFVLFAIFDTFWYFLALFVPFFVFFQKILLNLAFFVQYIPILFVAVTQCDNQKIHLLQWLSATNKTNLCHSDSVRQTIWRKKNIFLACDKGIGRRKTKNKHSFKFEFHYRYQITLGSIKGIPKLKINF